MKQTGPSGVSTTVSMASRVVPGMSCTIERSSPSSRLKSVDLPTLGRPMMATRGVPGVRSALAAQPLARDVVGTPRPSRPGGKRPTTSSSRSPVPRPCRELTGKGSPSPRETNSQACASRAASSTLLATRRTGGPERRMTSAAARSSSVTPVVTSTTMRTTSASARARSACSLTLASSVVAAGQPAAGVHDGEGNAGPVGRQDLAVAGDPLLLLDHGRPAPDDPVDERGLAHVGATGDHDHRERHAAHAGRNDVPSRARRSDAPSHGTTSTARGRSASVRPSRKRPSFRQASGSR